MRYLARLKLNKIENDNNELNSIRFKNLVGVCSFFAYWFGSARLSIALFGSCIIQRIDSLNTFKIQWIHGIHCDDGNGIKLYF